MEKILHKQQQKINLIVVLEHRFQKTPDGALWTLTMFPYKFWQRYLEVFDHVRIVARVCDVESIPPHWQRVNGEGVSFVPIPYYIGPQQYLLRVRQVNQAVRNAFTPGDAVIMRIPSQVATHLQPLLKQYKYPYGIEVVADPYDVFAPGSVKHPLRNFFRWLFPRRLQRLCAGACAAAYVTEHTLQKRYPPAKSAFSTHYSSVELFDEAFVTVPRVPTQKNQFTIITVGTLDQLYKAPDVLIKAVAICVNKGLNLQLVLVGDGQYRRELEAQVAELGLTQQVNFLGELPAGDAVRTQLDQADIFVLPSHQEGLPRAMIEAMARALPCIGSTVGGFPELLPPEYMVLPGDIEGLARKIQQVLSDSQGMARMSARNLQKASNYREEVLRLRRACLYREVREKTEQWRKMHLGTEELPNKKIPTAMNAVGQWAGSRVQRGRKSL